MLLFTHLSQKIKESKHFTRYCINCELAAGIARRDRVLDGPKGAGVPIGCVHRENLRARLHAVLNVTTVVARRKNWHVVIDILNSYLDD